MTSFSGFDRSVNRRNEFNHIEQYSCDHVSNVTVCHLAVTKNEGNCPPKTITINYQKRSLRDQSLRTMPTDKVTSLSIAHIENQGCDKVNYCKYSIPN